MISKMTIISLLNLIFASFLLAENYPDQHYLFDINQIFSNIETNNNVVLSDDEQNIQLINGATQGYIILKPDSSNSPFNRGLPSWNGTVTDDNSGFHGSYVPITLIIAVSIFKCDSLIMMDGLHG